MKDDSGGRSLLISRFFYGAAALAAVTFIVSWIIEGYEAEIQQRDVEVFTTHASVFFVITVITLILGVIVARRRN